MTRDPGIPAHFDTSGGVFHDRRYDRQRIEDATRRTIEMPEHQITTHVEYNLVTGEYQVVLNPDADYLPSRVKLYLPRETSQALARDLAAQQAEADKRNHAEDPERHAVPATAKVLDEAEVRSIPFSQQASGCPVCGSPQWGYDLTDGEESGLGPASCDRGHTWVVTDG